MKLWLENLPMLSTTLSALFFILGILLGLSINPVFFAFAILAIITPDILREFGWLIDMDEFQLNASRKASHHAYIVSLIFFSIETAILPENIELPRDIITLSLVIMIIVKFSSYMMQFWDKKKAAFRILLFCFIFWSAFVVLSNHSIKTLLTMLLLIPFPFLVLAILTTISPLLTGIISCALSIVTIPVYLLYIYPRAVALRGIKSFIGLFAIFLFMILPLAAAGISLITYFKSSKIYKNEEEVK